MAISFGAMPADGDQLDQNYLWTQLGFIETYICGGVVQADITASSIKSIHIFRPEVYPNGAEGVAGGMWGTGTVASVGDPRFNANRQDILKEACLNGGRAVIHKLSQTIYVPAACKANLYANVGVYILESGVGTGGSIPYTIANRICGYIRMVVRDRASNTDTVLTATTRSIEANVFSRRSRVNKVMNARHSFAAAGHYDVFVEYLLTTPGTMHANLLGILVGDGNLAIERLNTP